jgi:hypothetical protein
MTISKKRNNPHVCPQWLDTDTFTYQEQITIQKYKKVLESGNEKTAMGCSRFITSNEWEENIKNPFDSGAREQCLQHVSVLRDPRKSKTKKVITTLWVNICKFYYQCWGCGSQRKTA